MSFSLSWKDVQSASRYHVNLLIFKVDSFSVTPHSKPTLTSNPRGPRRGPGVGFENADRRSDSGKFVFQSNVVTGRVPAFVVSRNVAENDGVRVIESLSSKTGCDQEVADRTPAGIGLANAEKREEND